MKIKSGFIVQKIIDDYIVVPTGDNIVDFAVAVSLNESGAYLWELLQEETEEANLVESMLKEFEGVDEATAKADVSEFLTLLRENGFLEE
ncbi:MAG: PqqD family protein [Clostridia bacterium]|nr:PqqD family protein [Clostridia bacterium]